MNRRYPWIINGAVPHLPNIVRSRIKIGERPVRMRLNQGQQGKQPGIRFFKRQMTPQTRYKISHQGVGAMVQKLDRALPLMLVEYNAQLQNRMPPIAQMIVLKGNTIREFSSDRIHAKKQRDTTTIKRIPHDEAPTKKSRDSALS